MMSERLAGLATVLAIALASAGCFPVAAQRPSNVPAGSAGESSSVATSSPGRGAVAQSPAVPPAPRAATPRPSPTPRHVPATPVPPTASGAIAFQLRTALDRAREDLRIPGISVTILFPDGTAWTGVSGLADVGAGEPVTPDTAFAIASITKTFVAALVLELSADGALGLEEPVAALLPELDLDAGVTVHMLLDHTSGLQDYFLSPRIDAALQGDRAAAWSAARALRYVGPPYFEPGTGWHYSNTNYLLLGLVAERVGNASVATQLRERFLDPLGLETAFYQASEMPRGPVTHGYRTSGTGTTARTTDLSDGTGIAPFRSVVTASGAAGSLAASSADVAEWARALYSGDAIGPESLSLMLSGVDHVAGYRPRVPYGLGVQAIPVDGRRAFGHSGRFLGFRGVMRWLPDDEVAIAVLTNQSRVDPGPILTRLLRIALPLPGRLPAPSKA